MTTESKEEAGRGERVTSPVSPLEALLKQANRQYYDGDTPRFIATLKAMREANNRPQTLVNQGNL